MHEKLKQYEAWEEFLGEARSVTFAPLETIEAHKKQGLLSVNSKLIHVITAASADEAKAIFELRMGHGPYHPLGEPHKCPKGCGCYFYPQSAGECPYCGNIC